jgi:Domain of unknown function (DUF222)
VVPALVELSPPDVTTAMKAWREAATPQAEPRPERPQVLHLSRTLADRWRTDGSLGPETGELLASALRLAQTPDDEGQPARSPATRRADALGDICRHFLDHQQTRRGGRHRPHLNLVIDIERHLTHPGAGATTPDGTRLDRTPSTGCCATPPCTGCSPWAAPRSWTTAPPPAPSPPPCSTPWSSATGTAASPAVTAPPTGARATTSAAGTTADPPNSPISSLLGVPSGGAPTQVKPHRRP